MHFLQTNHLNVQKSNNKKETTRTTKETKNEVNVITITEEDKEPPKSVSFQVLGKFFRYVSKKYIVIGHRILFNLCHCFYEISCLYHTDLRTLMRR